MALLAPGGAAFAGDPTSSAPTSAGTLAPGEGPDDGLTINFIGSGPVQGLPVEVQVDPAGSLPWDLLPLVLGATAPPAAAPPAGAAVHQQPAASPSSAARPAPPLSPALDTVALALRDPSPPAGPAVEPAAAAPSPAATTPASAAVTPRVDASSSSPGLAGTGTPVVAALAGLVLLAIGGFLTWARARG